MRDGPDGFFVFTHTTLPQRPPTTQTPHKQQLQFDYQGGSLGFADGGGVDNTAIIPLLRRRCTRIIAGTATVESPAASNATAWAASQWDVAGLFGAVKAETFNKTGKVNNMPVAAFNKFMQVRRLCGVVRVGRACCACCARSGLGVGRGKA